MKRLRVMHVVVGGDIGGAERVVVDLATRPDVTGADHVVALITPNRALAGYFGKAGVRVHDRGPARENPLAYLYRSLGPSDVAWLAERIATDAIDVVHTHTFGSHVLGTRAARRVRRPQVRTEHHVIFAVTDLGPGIPPEVKGKVFDWFESHSNGSRHRGAGLGLPLVKSFVELHGGSVRVDSIVGRGTTVTCDFPIDQAAQRNAAE